MSSLSEKMISEFVESTTPAKEERSHEFTINGTVTSVDHNGVANVMLDGGAETPCQTTVSCSTGDRVIVSFKNREPVVTSNISKPTATLEEVNAKVVNAVNVFAENGTFSGTLSAAKGQFAGNLVVHHSGTNSDVYIGNEFTFPIYMESGSTRLQMYSGAIVLDDRSAGGVTSQLTKDNISFDDSGSHYAYFDCLGPHPASDIRLKEHITEIDPQLAKHLQPVQFRFKGDDTLHYGFIAQDVGKIIPGVVSEGKNGYLTLTYHELIAPLYALVQELQKEIDEMRKEVKALET